MLLVFTKKGVLEGQRKIESSESIPFIATWNIATLPSDLPVAECSLMEMPN